MRLGIITPLWKRPEVAEIVLDYWSDLAYDHGLRPDGVELVLQSVVSPEDPTDWDGLIPEPWRVVEVPNSPLTGKHNAACRELEGEVDAIMFGDSDDLITPKWIEKVAREDVAWPASLYVYDATSGRMILAMPEITCAGLLMSSEVLEAGDWAPFPLVDEKVDTALIKHIPALEGAKTLNSGAEAILDIKNTCNITPFERLQGECFTTPVDGEGVLRDRFPHQADRVLAL